MICVKKVEPKYNNGKKVITIKDAFLNQDGIICDECGAVGVQLKPELPELNSKFTFKITFEILDDDLDNEPEESEDSTLPF